MHNLGSSYYLACYQSIPGFIDESWNHIIKKLHVWKVLDIFCTIWKIGVQIHKPDQEVFSNQFETILLLKIYIEILKKLVVLFIEISSLNFTYGWKEFNSWNVLDRSSTYQYYNLGVNFGLLRRDFSEFTRTIYAMMLP